MMVIRFSNHYQSDKSIYNFRVVGWQFSYLIQKLTYPNFLRKQWRQDQTCSAMPGQGLHGLPMFPKTRVVNLGT